MLEPERTSNENAYTFTLPASWTSGTISLRGNVFQEPGFPQPGRRPECETPECKSNNSFTIKDVTFHDTKSVELDTVALSVNGELPVSASVALEDAQLVTPMANPGWNLHNPNDGFTVLPYQGIIDISDIVNSSKNETDKGGDAHGRVKDWASAMGNPNFSTMGLGKGGFRGVTGGGIESAFGTFGNVSAITFNPANPPGNRPLSGVAHELFHQFGLAHASSECGGGDDGDSDDEGQSGTPWPLKPGETHASEAAVLGEPGQFVNDGGDNPNSTEGFGQLLGIGLRMDSYPYRIVADGVNWGQNMDLMSYCAAKTGGRGGGRPRRLGLADQLGGRLSRPSPRAEMLALPASPVEQLLAQPVSPGCAASEPLRVAKRARPGAGPVGPTPASIAGACAWLATTTGRASTSPASARRSGRR